MDSRKKAGRSIVASEGALSEVLGFSLTLGLMVLALGVIGVAGYPMLEHMQERGHLLNIEQSFSVLQPNINKVAYGKAPSQSVELKMYGSTVSVTGTSRINLSMQIWNDTISGYDNPSLGRQMRTIENQYAENSIAYENTGTWAKYSNGQAVMVSEPRFTYGNNALVIPVVRIDGLTSLSGSGLVRVTADSETKKVERYENVSRVNISITSDYFEAWSRYLNESLQMPIVMVDTDNKTINASKEYFTNIDVYVASSPMTVTVN